MDISVWGLLYLTDSVIIDRRIGSFGNILAFILLPFDHYTSASSAKLLTLVWKLILWV